MIYTFTCIEKRGKIHEGPSTERNICYITCSSLSDLIVTVWNPVWDEIKINVQIYHKRLLWLTNNIHMSNRAGRCIMLSFVWGVMLGVLVPKYTLKEQSLLRMYIWLYSFLENLNVSLPSMFQNLLKI